MEPYAPFLDTDPVVYWRIWEVNVHGLINIARDFLPTLLSSRASNNALCTMINVASSGALSVRAGSSDYRISKLAVMRWIGTMQLDYGKRGLLNFWVNLGALTTEISQSVIGCRILQRLLVTQLHG